MQTTSNILAQHRRGLRGVVSLEQKRGGVIWSQFVGLENSEWESETLSSIDDFPYAEVVNEATPISLNTRSAPFSMTITPKMKALGYSITKLAKATDGYGKIGRYAKELMNSMLATREQNGANTLSLGFTAPGSGGTKTLDGLALFSASHTLASGTDSNLLTSSALANATMETAVQTARTVMSHKGKPSVYSGKFWLVVPPELEMLARRLVTATGYPQTNYNDKNPAGMTLDVLVNPYLTSATSWFVVPQDVSASGLKRMVNLPLEADVTYENNPPSYEHIVTESDAFYAENWRHCVGCQA